MNAGTVIGLIVFLIGILFLVLWGFNTAGRSNLLVPGIICSAGGFIVMWMFGRGGKSKG
jgi:hypothetical protein